MTPEIKQRIEQIRHGIVPEGYKKTSIVVIPKEWEAIHFKEMFSRQTRRNSEGNTNVLTISARYGLISQEDFFGKGIASEDKSNYFLLYKGDFAYNKSYSNGYPYGAIKVLDKYEKGIVSPLYICFSAAKENGCPEYYVQYFESGLLNHEINAFAQEGARNHGLLNISVDDFFNSRILYPPITEQRKIAEILTTQDKLIELQQSQINELKKLKKLV
ncbi:MAG: restriction endonuclease subunit S [Clostridia bacterium]|nr:restriction endonuclease subunit S [Clostridia bacterium]